MESISTKKNSSHSTKTLLLGIWFHVSRRRRIQMGLLLLLMLSSGAAELLSLGAILPFLSVLSNPEQLWQQPVVQSFVSTFNLTQPNDLLLPASFVFATAAVLAALIRLANLRVNVRLAAAVGSDLSCDSYRRTLYQPYSVHVERNSSELITSITSQISKTVSAILFLFQLITASVVALALLLGLLLISWKVAIAAFVLFGSVYVLLALKSQHELRRNSYKISAKKTEQMQALQEGLGAVRDVVLDGNQEMYVDVYRQADQLQRKLEARNQYLAMFPRYAVEAIGLVGMALLGGLLAMQQGSSSNVIPLLGVMALGAQRLLPTLQQIYSSWSIIKGFQADIGGVLEMLNQSIPQVMVDSYPPLQIQKSICFESVSFRYSTEKQLVLENINIEIHRGQRVGLVGSTGSGKSTLVDILMSLLEPTSGRILVDGNDLNDTQNPNLLLSWRSSIAHVPQHIFLNDCSIVENIALGVPRDLIDIERVKWAAKVAQISDFIEDSLEGYSSFVGERGIRLSGGQRQRIGIARAMYKQSSILVFDEATSALDTTTEESLMSAIDSLSKSLTIIMIAHRTSTLRNCDKIIHLESGKIVGTDF